jgi:hypothetical protein
LIRICLPPEMVQIYISPHFSKSIATTHKYGLLNYKHLQANCINHNNNTWTQVMQHDGQYSIAPKINQKYAIWKEHQIFRRNYYLDNNRIYITQLISHKSKSRTGLKAGAFL